MVVKKVLDEGDPAPETVEELGWNATEVVVGDGDEDQTKQEEEGTFT